MKKKLFFCLVSAVVFNLVVATSALAIPSPDVVVGLFASAAQIVVLFTAMLGGLGFATKKNQQLFNSKNQTSSPRKKQFLILVTVLLIISLGINLLQYTYQVDRQNQRLQTNLTRSSVEQGEKVGDTSLKTLSLSEQINSEQGITTNQLKEYINNNPSEYNIIDVRESEEVEMGKLSQADVINYPDLKNNPQLAIEKGKETILFCYSGNRSSELCQELTKKGIPCKFVIGGYEKWIAEGNSLNEKGERENLRAIADYPNKDVLLDTPEVQSLVKQEQAIFVDVRYPKDFKLDHLPNAYNIPIRKLTMAQSDREILALPPRPVVATCYDKRSCFYSLIMGLRLYRQGYDYRGRYTVPHEYVQGNSQREYVAQWQENNDKTLLGTMATPLKITLEKLNQLTGNFPLAIFLTVLLLRLLITPLTLKGEKDQLVLKQLAPSIQKLKIKFKDNKSKYSRAILKLYRKHHITPTFNLFGTLIQVLVFILLFRVVNQLTQNIPQSFLWLSSLANIDRYYLLPLLIAGLTTVTVRLNANNPNQKSSLAIQIGSGVLLFLMTFRLISGVNLYLVFSLLLMLLQKQIIAKFLLPKTTSDSTQNFVPLTSNDIVPLINAHKVSGCGGKATRLGQLLDDGFPVPLGFVIPSNLLGNNKLKIELSAQNKQQIEQLWQKLQLSLVAVRSSGENEDGEQHSYAGMFSSVLKVSYDRLYDAFKKVYDSQTSLRVDAYQTISQDFQIEGAILVQEMVEAEYSGVMFTKHPANPNTLLIEVVSGLGEGLVSGEITPESYNYGRMTNQLLNDQIPPPINFNPLIMLGKQIEEKFGKPQDIEWSYADGQFWILQSRDITASINFDDLEEDNYLNNLPENHHLSVNSFEQEKHRLLNFFKDIEPDEIVLQQNELSELLPCPTPYSLSLMSALWENGGSTDIACQNLGLAYDVDEDNTSSLLTTVFGTLYVNRIEEKSHRHLDLNFLTTLSLIKKIDRLEKEYHQDFLPYFQQQVRLKEVIDFSRLSDGELLELYQDWRTNFIEQTYVQAQMINIAAEFSLQLAQRELTQRSLNPAIYLSQIPQTIVNKAMSILPQIKAKKVSVEAFIDIFGHRAPYDFELAQPRYCESLELVDQLVANASFDYSKSSHEEKKPEPELPSSKLLQVTIKRSRTFQTLKEEAKHHSLRELSLLRYLLLEIGQRFNLGEDIFYLTHQQILQLPEQDFSVKILKLRSQKKQNVKFSEQLNLPTQLTLAQLEALNLEQNNLSVVQMNDQEMLQGILVAGKAPIQGEVQIITDDRDINQFKEGNILVTRFTHPSWTPLFPKAKGVVTELGGWLSHAAIVAREFDIPTIVSAKGVLNKLKTGDLIQINADGTIEKITQEASSRLKNYLRN